MKQNINEKKISSVCAGDMQTSELNADEKRAWLDRFSEIMGEPGPEEVAFFAARADRDR